jgi:hypothetical protein
LKPVPQTSSLSLLDNKNNKMILDDGEVVIVRPIFIFPKLLISILVIVCSIFISLINPIPIGSVCQQLSHRPTSVWLRRNEQTF